MSYLPFCSMSSYRPYNIHRPTLHFITWIRVHVDIDWAIVIITSRKSRLFKYVIFNSISWWMNLGILISPSLVAPKGPIQQAFQTCHGWVYSKAVSVNQLEESPVSGSSSSPRALSAWTFGKLSESHKKEVSTATVENAGKVQGCARHFSDDCKISMPFVLGHCPKTVQDARTATALQWLKRWSLQSRYLMTFLLFPLGASIWSMAALVEIIQLMATTIEHDLTVHIKAISAIIVWLVECQRNPRLFPRNHCCHQWPELSEDVW